jgi:putative transposase
VAISGSSKIDPALAALIVRMAQDNRSWGYDRIVGALANLGYTVSDQTVGNITPTQTATSELVKPSLAELAQVIKAGLCIVACCKRGKVRWGWTNTRCAPGRAGITT